METGTEEGGNVTDGQSHGFRARLSRHETRPGPPIGRVGGQSSGWVGGCSAETMSNGGHKLCAEI